MGKRKIFVLDTCVILYDHTAYKKFGSHNIVIPIAVLEELDHFKKGNEAINFEARQFIRIIDKLAVDGLKDWVDIGEEGAGQIKVSFQETRPSIDAEEIFHDHKADHRILNVAILTQEQNPDAEIILVSKDVNLRVKAKSLGVATEDYRTDIPRDVHHKHTGKYEITNVDDELIDGLYKEDGMPIKLFSKFNGYPKVGESESINNAYFIISSASSKKSALAWCDPEDHKLYVLNKQPVSSIKPRNAEQVFAIHAILHDDIKIVSIQGHAGCLHPDEEIVVYRFKSTEIYNTITLNDIINEFKVCYVDEDFFKFANTKFEDIEKLSDEGIASLFSNHVHENAEKINIKDFYESSDSFMVSTPDGFQLVGEKIKKTPRQCYFVKTLNGKTIHCSEDHLIETTAGWVLTKDLKEGDLVITDDGISSISKIEKTEISEVYDFEVLHENHRYWGGTGISSHNTGKTLMAIAGAIEQAKDFEEICIARPIVPLNNRDIGYLPGDADTKIAPYMAPIWDNIKFIKSQSHQSIDDEIFTVTPLAYIRGRSMSDVLFIVDEAQNLSPIEIKTIITRIGENSKIIFTGDVAQIDSPFLDQNSNGLSYMIDRLKGESIYAHVTLEKGERSDVATLAANKL